MTARVRFPLRKTVMLVAGVLAGALFAPSGATAAEQLVPKDQATQVVNVTDVAMQDGTITGKLVNKSNDTLRDVKLIIDQAWLWNNERRPGTDNPSRTDFYVVPEIPPRGSVTFQYRSPAPTQRTDGHFTAHVEVESFTQVGS